MQEHIKIGDTVLIIWKNSGNLVNGLSLGDCTEHLIIGRVGTRPIILILNPYVGWFIGEGRLIELNIDRKYLGKHGWMVDIHHHDVTHYCQNTVKRKCPN